MKDRYEHKEETIAGDLVDSLHRQDRHAGIHLARLILADKRDEGGAYQAFARALTVQLQHWPGVLQTIQEDDVAAMIKAAARELLEAGWDD